ncbi:AcrB/AcrD/AcrF family protein [Rhodobacterales bacterium HKCCE2091]|nr:AcrB/AcrD/AcrF family protein [Rhodobacterales bacterium HKCCE2091]
MSIARSSIDRPLLTWLLMLFCLFGGMWGFFSIGRLEDPAFTIPVAVVVTEYPGASAEQVAREVSEPLETAIQGLAEVDRITSVNRPGSSRIEVEIADTFGGDQLPAIWTKLRAEIRDAARRLPDGVGEPFVNDSFGDVFGLFYAVTAEGLTDAERHDLARFLRREILAVEGVANVAVAGLPEEVIHISSDLVLAVNQGVSPGLLVNAVATANSVAEAGSLGPTRIEAPEGSDSVSEISRLTVGVGGELLNLVDVAGVSRDRAEDPDVLIRFDGEEAFTIGVAGQTDANIVEVGQRVDAQLEQLFADIPYGVSLHPIYQQHVVVDRASTDFLLSLAMSVGIVVGVLTLFMGWRAAVVVGVTLLLTVVGTFFFMAIFEIEMERISLGALIIAMGMLVDNAIVVAEGMQISMQHGQSSRDAAEDTAKKTQIPLLGATVIGIMAFAGIGLSNDTTGEFLFSLFAVVGISLLLSWLLAITVAPLLGHYLFRRGSADEGDAYGGVVFRTYGAILRGALRVRWLVLAALVAVTAVCYAGFGRIEQQFFPNSNTPLFFVHLKLPQGTEIAETSERIRVVEDWLQDRPEVLSTATFVGQGATRFLLTYSSESPNSSYAHIIIRTATIDEIPALRQELEDFAAEALPVGEFRTERLVFGPGGGSPIEVRFSGQDPAVLRALGAEAMARMQAATDHVEHLRTDWREQELVLVPRYATDRAQAAGVTRDDVAQALRFATDGQAAGVYREGERLIPIVARVDPRDGIRLGDQVIYSDASNSFIPLVQVIDGFDYEPQNTLVHRRDRVLTLTVQASIPPDVTAATVQAEVSDAIEAMPLPFGYAMEWGGEFEASGDANESLGGKLPVTLLIMVVISILLFNALRQPLIIWLLVPMAVNGVVIGLLGTGLPFTFTALLGLLSLSGMLIKNGIVLVEEIDLVRADGMALEPAIVRASVSRVRPVVLAAATTILGMAPLLSDAFFVSMAVTIMGGLAFASVLTLVAAPVLYRVFFARAARSEGAASPA